MPGSSSDASSFHHTRQRFDDRERNHPDDRVAERLRGNCLPRRREAAQPEHHVESHEQCLVRRRRPDERHKPRQRRGDDELLPDRADDKSHDRLCQPADTEHTGRELVLNQPGDAAGQHAAHRTAGQRDVDHGHQHEIDRRRAADDETGQRGLQR